jgi:hypothetical protein
MNKLVLSVALVLGLGMMQAQAQEVLGGIKVNANMSNFILNDTVKPNGQKNCR